MQVYKTDIGKTGQRSYEEIASLFRLYDLWQHSQRSWVSNHTPMMFWCHVFLGTVMSPN